MPFPNKVADPCFTVGPSSQPLLLWQRCNWHFCLRSYSTTGQSDPPKKRPVDVTPLLKISAYSRHHFAAPLSMVVKAFAQHPWTLPSTLASQNAPRSLQCPLQPPASSTFSPFPSSLFYTQCPLPNPLPAVSVQAPLSRSATS